MSSGPFVPRRPRPRAAAQAGGRTILLVLLLLGTPCQAPRAAPPDPGGPELFEGQVRPLLVKHCYECHSGQARKVRGGLLLDSKAGWTRGGARGPTIEPGDPDNSL